MKLAQVLAVLSLPWMPAPSRTPNGIFTFTTTY
jgi:hypothetical protein